MADEYPTDKPPPFWDAMQRLVIDREKMGMRMDTLETSFLRHIELHNGITRSLEEINRKLEANGLVLVEMKAAIDVQKNEVKSLWDFPKNSLTIMSLLSGTAYGFYKLWGWIVHAGDVKLK